MMLLDDTASSQNAIAFSKFSVIALFSVINSKIRYINQIMFFLVHRVNNDHKNKLKVTNFTFEVNF